MKKTTFLFLFFTTTLLIAQSNPYRNHTFFRTIKNVGDITETIALANCNTTFSFTDFRARDRVSIAIAERLESKQFYLLDFGEGLNYYYLWLSGDDEHSDWDHRVDGETMTIQRVCPVPSDQDGDGVPDDMDDCPNEAGLIALNGCPRGPLQTIDIIDFKVNEPTNQSFTSGNRFDFEFKIRGDYSYAANGYHQIDLFLYKGNTTSSSNEIGRIFWNRENDVDIIYTNYFTKTSWLTSLINYSTNPGQVFTLKVNYANSTKTFTYIYPDPDSDGDGIPDSQDGCPDEIGPESNNGCPLPSGPAEFIIDQVVIKGKNEFNDKRTLFDSKDRLSYPSVKFFRNENIEIEVKIKNTGGSPGGTEGIFGYNNNPNNFLGGLDDCILRELSDSNLAPDEVKSFKFDQHISEVFPGVGCPNVAFSGHFWFFADDTWTFGEVVSFIVNDRTKKIPVLASGPKLQINLNNFVGTQSYVVDIYDLTGRKIASKNVSNTMEETETALSLPSGLYIIKSVKGDRKIFVN
ncbi:hypothetical protein FGF1_24680 [Flavobacteriaceae bacterium GF1]